MQDILSSLPRIFDGFDGDSPAPEAIVFAAWKTVVGDGLSPHSVPMRLIKRKLIVAVASETWRKQVVDLADQMVFKLNAALGSPLVSFVEFRIDAKMVREHRSKLEAKQMADVEWEALAKNEVTPRLENAAETITDESLRSIFLAAAGGSLARRRKHDR
ncbi:MAG: DciA family protein [Pyrinomonadaceae bacterium]